jgi:hypothetical protein
MKRCPLAVLAVALVLAVLSPAVPSHAAVAEMAGPASPVSCAAATVGLSFLWRTGEGCLSSFCRSDEDCPCATATSATCSGGTCQYTFPGGGGGDPHGCSHGFCNSTLDCLCMDGTYAACLNNLCTF